MPFAPEIFAMTSLLNFHGLAATRGDGLRPELRALFERIASAPHCELAARADGMIQSGPDPLSTKTMKQRGSVSLFPKASAVVLENLT